MHAISPVQHFLLFVLMSPATYILLTISFLTGMYFLGGWVRRLVDTRRRDSSTLSRYRLTLSQYQRWLGEFPEVARVLDNLEVESEGGSLNAGTPTGLENCTVSGLRDQLRRMQKASVKAVGGVTP